MDRGAVLRAASIRTPGRTDRLGDRDGPEEPGWLEGAFRPVSEADTLAVGRALAPVVEPGDVVALWGDLGAGKTVLARALIQARCTAGEGVPSPTFTLVQTYPPVPPYSGDVWHFDLYRLGGPEEAWELGVEEAFASGVAVIEWPGRLGPLLPADRLDVFLAHGSRTDTRLLRLGGSERWRQRLRELGLA